MNHIASPDNSDPGIERAIQAAGLTAPRVTPPQVAANIVAEYFFTADKATAGCPQLPELSLLTFCVLVLRNGFTVTGESACASPENFDADIGRRIAREHAVNKIWPLMGYALKDQIWRDSEDAIQILFAQGTDVPPYQQRVLDERESLADKADKLHVFIDSEKFTALPPVDRELLTRQFASMEEYLQVLNQRIAGF